MSRIGKNPITIPSGVEYQILQTEIMAKGPKGTLRMPIRSDVQVTSEDGKIVVKPLNESKESRMMWGTTRNLIQNLITGVHQGFTINLELNGVGYRASVQGKQLVLQLGYSHDVIFDIPEGITIHCEKPTNIALSGADKQKVGQAAANIRSFRPPEPYKGKGIKYSDEKILRKEGKKK